MWLKPAARQAIMAAFGADGTAVIRATNEYLNGIAASDKAKATALAWFINEDPMMVCSLGLEPQGVTMPIRGLRATGTQYIITNINARNTLNTELKVANVIQNAGENILMGAGASWSNMYGINWSKNNNKVIPYIYYDGVGTRAGMPTDATFVMNQSGFYIDGEQYLSKTPGSTGSTRAIALFAGNWSSISYKSKFDLVHCKLTENGTEVGWFIPFLHKVNGNEIACALNLTEVGVQGANPIYENQGTGSFTIPDISYTPTP